MPSYPYQEGRKPYLYTHPLPGGKPCSLTTKEAATIFKRSSPGAEGNKLLNRELRSGGRHVLWHFSFLYLLFYVPNQPPHSLLPQFQQFPTRTPMPCQQGETCGMGHRDKARGRWARSRGTRGRRRVKSESGSGVPPRPRQEGKPVTQREQSTVSACYM